MLYTLPPISKTTIHVSNPPPSTILISFSLCFSIKHLQCTNRARSEREAKKGRMGKRKRERGGLDLRVLPARAELGTERRERRMVGMEDVDGVEGGRRGESEALEGKGCKLTLHLSFTQSCQGHHFLLSVCFYCWLIFCCYSWLAHLSLFICVLCLQFISYFRL